MVPLGRKEYRLGARDPEWRAQALRPEGDPMKIGFVSEMYYPWPGGASERLYYLARELRARGHEVRIITGQADTQLARLQSRLPMVSVGRSHLGTAPDESDVIRIGRSVARRSDGGVRVRTVGTRLGAHLRRILRTEKFDLLHVHDPVSPTLPRLASTLAACPVVGTFVSTDGGEGRLNRRWPRAHHGVVQKLAAHVAVSEGTREALGDLLEGVECHVVPNGVDVDRFTPEGSTLAGRFGAHKKNLVFVGQLVKRKGVDVLLEAFRELSERRGDVRLIAVGDGPHARVVDRVKSPDVHYLGHRRGKALAQCYEIADVFVSPSLGPETYGPTLLEAMAAGKPIVATNVDGYRGLVENEREALLVPPGSSSRLGNAIERVLDDEMLARRLSDTGTRRVQTYSWGRVADEVESIYHDVLGDPRSRVAGAD